MSSIQLMYPNASLVTAGGTLIDYMQEAKGFREGLNAASYSLKWAKIYYGGLSNKSAKLLEGIEDAKSPFAIQKAIFIFKNFINHCIKLKNEKERKTSALKEIFSDGLDMIGPSKDFLRFAHSHDVFSVNPRALATLDLLGTCSLIIGPGQGMYGTFNKICELVDKNSDPALTEDERIFNKAAIAKIFVTFVVCGSYTSMGLLIATSMLLRIKLAGWVTLALSTNAFIFGISGYLHEKLSVLGKA